MVGGSSLSELQTSLGLAEQEREGGVSPHVGPFVNVSDVGSLLTSAEFTLPTVDVDTISIGFPDAMVVMEHLQRMGEGNACLNRRDRVPRDTFLAACAIYQNLFRVDPYECNGVDAADHDDVKVTIQVIYAIGWTPHVSQQRPLTRGSATQKIKDI